VLRLSHQKHSNTSLVAFSEHTVQFSGLFFISDSVLGCLLLLTNMVLPNDTRLNWEKHHTTEELEYSWPFEVPLKLALYHVILFSLEGRAEEVKTMYKLKLPKVCVKFCFSC